MMVLFLGGVESTAGLIGTLFKLLAENPDQRAILRANPALIPDAVEEAIRIATPLQLVGRTTSREVTLHGVTIPAGGRVVLVYGAANRDERRFADPDRFDVTRGKQRHLGLRRGHARLHRRAAGPAGGQDRAGGGAAAPGRLHDHRRRPSATGPRRTCTSGSTCTWRSRSPSRRTASTRAHVETVQRHHTDTTVRHPRAGDRRPGRGQGRGGRRRRRADPAAGRRHPAAPRGRPARTSTSILGDGVPNRQYSLCGDPADHHLPARHPARRRAAAAARGYVHDRLAAGDVVRVRGPRNNFALVPSPRYLFIAGGIGITPILPMIAAAEAAGADWRLLYGGRHRGVDGVPRRARRLRRPRHRVRRRTRPACSTSTPCSAPRSRTRSSTAAGPSRCSPPSRSAAAAWPSRVAARRAVRRPAADRARSAPRRSTSSWRAAGSP